MPITKPVGMAIEPRFTKVNGKHAIIDTDGFVQRRELFSLEGIVKHLNEIHNVISAAFRATVTPKALKVWDE